MSELDQLLTRLISERGDAWYRASLFARHADRLETVLRRISECPCCEQFSCAETASDGLEYAQKIFMEEWDKLKKSE